MCRPRTDEPAARWVKDLKRPATRCVDDLPARDLAVEGRNERGAGSAVWRTVAEIAIALLGSALVNGLPSVTVAAWRRKRRGARGPRRPLRRRLSA